MLVNYSWLQFRTDTLCISAVVLAWTFAAYWLHRLSHISHVKNPLWHIHRAHHTIPYLSEPTGSKIPRIGQFFMWFGSWRTTLDVFIVLTIPAVIIAIISPRYGMPLLVFHYFYEVFCSEFALDHNPKIKGDITRAFAWGDFHLYHHMAPKYNFGLMITFWDRVFGTSVDPEPGTTEKRQQMLLNKGAKRA